MHDVITTLAGSATFQTLGASPDTPQELTGPALTKELKAELVAAFPGIMFSVRSARGSAYGWYDISWTDGPTLDAVRVISDKYQSSAFDGSDDSYRPTGARAWVGARGAWIRGTSRGILHNRSISEAYARSLVPAVVAKYGCAEPTGDFKRGDWWGQQVIEGETDRWSWNIVIHRLAGGEAL